MKKTLLIILIPIIIIAAIVLTGSNHIITNPSIPTIPSKPSISPKLTKPPQSISPLSIENLRQKSYPGSEITIERNLPSGTNYSQYLVSYKSEGLTIYSLLTVPQGSKPSSGWPVILLNHGYIPPAQYSTETSYSGFVDSFARSGFITFKPDYRGNGNSEGKPEQSYISPGYFIDSMNAISSIKKYKDANPEKIAVIGHSMGGNITLHELVVSTGIKAAVLIAGVVGSYQDILTWWDKRIATHVLTTPNDQDTAFKIKEYISQNGTPQTNPAFWNAIDPINYLSLVNIPVQVIVGSSDTVVPPEFSISLKNKLQKTGKVVDFHEYPGADHNLSPNTGTALNDAISFLKKYLK